MALADVRLSILAFPQRWRANALEARVLLLPAGDPTVPSATGLPAFAGTDWPLRATILPEPDALFGPSPGSAVGAHHHSFTASAPSKAKDLFDALATHFDIVPPAPAAARLAGLNGTSIRKELPSSYTEAIPFERPGAGTTIGNEFGCSLRDTVPALPDDPKPTNTLTWGAALSYALRQPLLARALGLIHDVTIPVGSPNLLEGGGWLYFEFDTGAPTPATPDTVRSYAARLPRLGADADRTLFGAVLFPVGLTAAGDYGDPLTEAAIYDDGFATIVHAAQAVTADAASSGHNELRPATDAGIDLGWDDEQVTTWLNRQISGLRARLDPTSKAVEAPLGVSGYRIDVRMPEDPAHGEWESLCRAFSVGPDGSPAPLRFPPEPAPAVFSESFDDGELTIEPTPVRSRHAAGGAAWLPRHFARWQDGSLVVNDTTLFRLTGETPRDADGQPITVPSPIYGAAAPGVRLRYGRLYEFRCRLADLTGGGPDEGSTPDNPGLRPTAAVRFLRHVPPKSVRVATDAAQAAPGDPTPSVSAITTLDVWRPLMGYPEMVFAGIDDPGVIEQLIQEAPAARAAGGAVGVNDPDVTDLLVSVQVRAPAHDPGPAGSRDGDFRELYSVTVPFPAFDPDAVLDPGAPLTLTLDYADVPDIDAMPVPAEGSTALPVPRARDVRLRLTPLCQDRPDYFGADWARRGLTVDIATRAPAQDETGLFAERDAELALNAIMLRPAPDMMQRLASRLGLTADGLTLAAPAGERVVFGASDAIRHTLSADRASITFATENELVGRWLAALRETMDRDWTWDGLEDEGIVVARRDRAGDPFRMTGQVRVPFAVSQLAVSGAPDGDRRARTRIVFFDAVDPKPAPGAFPDIQTPEWRLAPRLRDLPEPAGDALARTSSARLPVAVAPRQVPKLVSAGIALSPYLHDDTYSSTQARERVLWLEFEEPVADPNDAIFARVLAYGPDPLLAGDITQKLVAVPDTPFGPMTLFEAVERLLPTPPEPPDLPIDPEPMRVIVPAQPEDSSGLDAMTEMPGADPDAANTKPRHFIVPLPPALSPDSPELFGFWTYEIRIGHKEIWSTAQARFGRPLIVKGVQHPAPGLRCAAVRVRSGPLPINQPALPRRIVVTAPHATTVFADERLTRVEAGDPRTQMWVLLYAQVRQADGESWRNVLIAREPAPPRIERGMTGAPIVPRTRDIMGVAQFDEEEVERKLLDLALPPDTPLSVLAVELLPGGPTQRFGSPAVAVPSPFGALGSPQQGGDPLGQDLGSIVSRRILRCSPLTPVAPSC